MMMIKILLVEDNKIVREGLRELLNAQADMQVIGEAAEGIEALEMLRSGVLPDILLVDYNMPGIDGIELTRRICAENYPDVKIIILTMHAKRSFVESALESGAKGYLLKDGDFDAMYRGIRKINQHELFISAGISG